MDNTGTQINSEQLHRILEHDTLAIMGAKHIDPRPSNQYSLASSWSRVSARIFDIILINLFCIVLCIFILSLGLISIPESKISSNLLECFGGNTLYEIKQTYSCKETFELLKNYYVLALLLTMICNLFYFVYIPVKNLGATFGKQLFRIKIINDTKKSPNLRLVQNFWRELFFTVLQISLFIRWVDMIYISKNPQSVNQSFIVSIQILMILILLYSFCNIYFSVRGQSLSDKIANTLVVNE